MNTYWHSYLQNRTSLGDGRWVATLGLGYGENRVAAGPVRASDVMPNAALVFNATQRIALYASYATSYNPTDPGAEDVAGRRNAFAPTSGRNNEVGMKVDLPGRRSSMTLSLFKNDVSNGLVQSGPADLNPNGNRYFVEAGTRRSTGVELSADVQPWQDLRVSGSVSYLDAIYTGEGPASASATLALPGSRAEKSPVWSCGVRDPDTIGPRAGSRGWAAASASSGRALVSAATVPVRLQRPTPCCCRRSCAWTPALPIEIGRAHV